MKIYGTETQPSPEQEMDTIEAAMQRARDERTRNDRSSDTPASQGRMNAFYRELHTHNDRLGRILTRIEGVIGAFDGVPVISDFALADVCDSGAPGRGHMEALSEQLAELGARLDALDRAAEKLEEL